MSGHLIFPWLPSLPPIGIARFIFEEGQMLEEMEIYTSRTSIFKLVLLALLLVGRRWYSWKIQEVWY